jgi:dTDP-4-amino-4,6-dideoxygalactose transaminase
MGDIGSISFFPSKNLGCFGDGGALTTNNDELASKMRMIANHGQEVKYFHKVLGCNSRLDTIQAAILNVKLKKLNNYIKSRNEMANYYDENLIQIPLRQKNSTHVFHQYTLKIKNGARNDLQKFLATNKIPSMIYYPFPLYKQPAFQNYVTTDFQITNVENLCNQVISIPIHTEINWDHMKYICDKINQF